MTANAIEIQGTLQPDGTLVLDDKPNLPPGRVKVIVQPVLNYTQTDIWQFFQRIDAERKALGIVPPSKDEIDAYVATMREEGE
jgi:hypothetical protein